MAGPVLPVSTGASAEQLREQMDRRAVSQFLVALSKASATTKVNELQSNRREMH